MDGILLTEHKFERDGNFHGPVEENAQKRQIIHFYLILQISNLLTENEIHLRNFQQFKQYLNIFITYLNYNIRN